jgi:hypothetical protein
MENQKKYRERNKSRLRLGRKNYYDRNRDACIERGKAKIRCDICNIKMNYNSQFLHRKSQKHLKALSKIQKDNVRETTVLEKIEESGAPSNKPDVHPPKPSHLLKSKIAKMDDTQLLSYLDGRLRNHWSRLISDVVNIEDDNFEPIEETPSARSSNSFSRSSNTLWEPQRGKRVMCWSLDGSVEWLI